MMTSTDPISDYLTRIRNAVRAKHKKVDVPATNMKRALSKILAEHKFISGYTEIEDNKQGLLRIALRYTEGKSVISGLKRISTPGRRVYVSSRELPRVLNGLGIAVISTSKGIMTDRQAKEQHFGGEVICHIW
jgi:small subunit ribosomal protein S8